MVILDTCALLELGKTSKSLSNKTMGMIEKGAYILSISFAEVACKIKLGKLEMPFSVRELYQEYSDLESISIIDIGVDEWLDSIDLSWSENKDPVDRIITAFAIKRKLSIVSSDLKMKKFYKKVIW